MTGKNMPDPSEDLAGGDILKPVAGQTLDELLAESVSRRMHRFASAILVFVVVGVLLICVFILVCKIAEDLQHLTAPAVGAVASLITAISVLTFALAKFAFGLASAPESKKESQDPPAPLMLEALKLISTAVEKLSSILKSSTH